MRWRTGPHGHWGRSRLKDQRDPVLLSLLLLLLLRPAALVGDVDGNGLLRRHRRVVLLRDDVIQGAAAAAAADLLRRLLLLRLLVLRHRDQHLRRPGHGLGVVRLSGQCDDVGRPRALQDDGGRGRGARVALFWRLLLQLLQLLLLMLLLLSGVAHDYDLLRPRVGDGFVGLGPDRLRRHCGGRRGGGPLMNLVRSFDFSSDNF